MWQRCGMATGRAHLSGAALTEMERRGEVCGHDQTRLATARTGAEHGTAATRWFPAWTMVGGTAWSVVAIEVSSYGWPVARRCTHPSPAVQRGTVAGSMRACDTGRKRRGADATRGGAKSRGVVQDNLGPGVLMREGSAMDGRRDTVTSVHSGAADKLGGRESRRERETRGMGTRWLRTLLTSHGKR